MRRDAAWSGLGAAAAFTGVLAAATAVLGQNPAACLVEATGPLQIHRCQEGLRLTAERAALVATIERGGRVVGFRVEGGAALVEPGPTRVDAVEIVTPHATASVKGARIAFDIEPTRSAVFVREGEAVVRDGTREARLRDGDGVEIGPAPLPGPAPPRSVPPSRPSPQAAPAPSASPPSLRAGAPAPLEVRRWSPDRAERLLARVGL